LDKGFSRQARDLTPSRTENGGGGKGDIDRYVAVVTPGRVLFEVAGVSRDLVEKAFSRASTKLPFKTKVVMREE